MTRIPHTQACKTAGGRPPTEGGRRSRRTVPDRICNLCQPCWKSTCCAQRALLTSSGLKKVICHTFRFLMMALNWGLACSRTKLHFLCRVIKTNKQWEQCEQVQGLMKGPDEGFAWVDWPHGGRNHKSEEMWRLTIFLQMVCTLLCNLESEPQSGW